MFWLLMTSFDTNLNVDRTYEVTQFGTNNQIIDNEYLPLIERLEK